MNLSSKILVGCFIRTNNQPDTLIALRYMHLTLNTLLYVGITVVTCTLIQKIHVDSILPCICSVINQA